MMVVSGRKCFVGFFVTKKVREAIRAMASKEGMSVSMFCYKVMAEKAGLPEEVDAASLSDLLRMVK